MRVRSFLRGRKFDMTSMIDVVFLLLIFFVLTFRVVLPEGDFSIKLPPDAGEVKENTLREPIQVRLTADGQGELKEIIINNVSANKNFRELRARVLMAVGMARGKFSLIYGMV